MRAFLIFLKQRFMKNNFFTEDNPLASLSKEELEWLCLFAKDRHSEYKRVKEGESVWKATITGRALMGEFDPKTADSLLL